MNESVFVAAITALSTLLGVYLGGRQQDRATRMQLESSSKEREKERIHEMRRSIYLPAVRGMSNAIKSISSLTHEDADVAEVSSEFSCAISDVDGLALVAGEHLIEASTEFTMQTTKAFFSLLALRTRLNDGVVEKLVIGQSIDHSLAEQSRLVELLKKINIDGPSDPDQFNRVLKQLDLLTPELEGLFRRRDANQKAVEALHTELLAHLCDHTKPLVVSVTRATSRMRQELGLPSREDVFVDRAVENFDEISDIALRVAAELRTQGEK